MLIKELIRIFREQWIPVEDLKRMDKNAEATLDILRKNSVDKKVTAYFESMPLWKIRGIGPAKALELWHKGVRPGNIHQPKYLHMLPDATQLALRYNTLDRIPHTLVAKVAKKFMPIKTGYTVVGSYRRGTATSGDVDILYYGRDLERLLQQLEERHGDKWIVFAKGKTKIAGIFIYDSNTSVEVDIWIATPENRHSMLLYSTGSKRFNIVMRFIAKHKGLLLNQNGLFNIKTGKKIPTKTEHDIFDALGMKYRTPSHRT